jgi:hypothetical protein
LDNIRFDYLTAKIKMLSYEAARELALAYIQKFNESQIDFHPLYLGYLQRNDPDYQQQKNVIVLTNIHEESFGWIFFYNSKQFIDTGDFSYAIAGNAPIIINRMTGELSVTGTAHSIEYYIEEYQRRIDLGNI